MPGRQLTPAVGSYRYGFNGKELDDNGTGMGGGGATYDYGFRIYNPAIAKFLSVDPLTGAYPMLSSYQYASNTPIAAIDLDGLEAYIVTETQDEKGRVTKITVTRYEDVHGVAQDNRVVDNSTGDRVPYQEVIIFTKDANGDFVGQPRYSNELSPKQKLAMKRGKQEERGTHNYPGTGSDQFSTNINKGISGTFKSSTGHFDTKGRMSTSNSDYTTEDFGTFIDDRMADIDSDESVYRVDVYFSNEGLKDKLGNDAKAHYEELYPGAAVNLIVNEKVLDKNRMARSGEHLEKDSEGNANAIGVRIHTVEKEE